MSKAVYIVTHPVMRVKAGADQHDRRAMSVLVVNDSQSITCYDAQTFEMRYETTTTCANKRVRKVTDDTFVVCQHRGSGGGDQMHPLAFHDAETGEKIGESDAKLAMSWGLQAVVSPSSAFGDAPRVVWCDTEKAGTYKPEGMFSKVPVADGADMRHGAVVLHSETREKISGIPHAPSVRSMAFVPEWNDELYLGGYSDYHMYRYDLSKETAHLTQRMHHGDPKHYGGIWGLEACPTLKAVFTTSYDSHIQVWGRDVDSNVGKMRLKCGCRSSFAAEDKFLVFAGHDGGGLQVFDVRLLRDDGKLRPVWEKAQGWWEPVKRGSNVLYDFARVSEDVFLCGPVSLTAFRGSDGKVLRKTSAPPIYPGQSTAYRRSITAISVIGSDEYDRPRTLLRRDTELGSRLEFLAHMHSQAPMLQECVIGGERRVLRPRWC